MRSVNSFGRRPDHVGDQVVEEVVPVGPMVLPPVQMPPVTVPVVLVVDAESLSVAAGQISDMVTAAVRAGFARAVADIEEAADAALPDEAV